MPGSIDLRITITCILYLFIACAKATSSPRLFQASDLLAPSPGFGFELDPSRIAASVRHINGTFESYLFHPADGNYQALVRDASSGRARCWGDWPEGIITQQQSSPASPSEDLENNPSIDILAKVIKGARESLEQATGLAVNNAFISHPKLPGLCAEDIEAAMRRANIQVTHNSRIFSQPHKCSAAYASYGRGLCSDYTRRNPCEYEERYELPSRVVMAATYTDEAFLVEYKHMRYAFSPTWQTDSLIDWDAGADALRSNSDTRLHWDRIRVRLLDRPVYWKLHIDVLVLAGRYASNATFVSVVKDTFAKLQAEPPEILHGHDEFTGARGAAEFAFRAQYQH